MMANRRPRTKRLFHTDPGAIARSLAAAFVAWSVAACVFACVSAVAAAAVTGSGGVQQENAATDTAATNWLKKLSISGILDIDGRWRQYESVLIRGSGSASDLYVRQFNLGVEARLLQGASAIVVLKSEWIGDDVNQGDERISLDEVHFDLGGNPYLVLGKRTQPFGQFESDLVTDPMTQDAYETNRSGASFGIGGPWDMDVSATIYKGTEQMDHLFQSTFFDTTAVRRRAFAPEQVNSFIVSAQASPWPRHLTAFGACLSEPGWEHRNTSVDAGLFFVPPGFAKVSVTLEYMGAVSRELYVGLERRYLESALSASASYAFVVRGRSILGRRTYLGRRSSHASHPTVVTARYELFDDDGLASAVSSWSLRSRVSVGARYAFRNDGSVLAYLQFEARENGYRGEGLARDRDLELYLRAGIDF